MDHSQYRAYADGDRGDDPRPTMYHCPNCANDFACKGLDLNAAIAAERERWRNRVQNFLDHAMEMGPDHGGTQYWCGRVRQLLESKLGGSADE